MTARMKIDKAGRIVIPKAVRDALQLQPGDELEAVQDGDQLSLTPVVDEPVLQKEDGVWVFCPNEPLPDSMFKDTKKQILDEREARFFEGLR